MPVHSRIDDPCNSELDPQPAETASYFSAAHNITLKNANFIHVQGDYNFSEPRLGLTDLERHISHDAMFDSAARYPAGQCHPGTRTAIIREIRSWIDDPQAKHGIFWLHGSAGVGKSALMHTIAQLLHEESNGLYAASYFFAHGIAGREESSFLFPTLAYQVAVNLPTMRPLIEGALNRDPSLPTKSMPSQIKSLLSNPFKISLVNFKQHTPTVIIDGLDECNGSSSQTQILDCIAKALSSHLPLRFLIASRPEHWIKSAFLREPLISITRSLSLNGQFTSHDAYNDIQMFLEDGFADIYAMYLDVIGHSKEPWPSSEVIRTLVENASNQFIYASTVLKFVGQSADFCDPRDRLAIILTDTKDDDGLRSSAFSEIDRLYIRILSAYPRQEPLKKVLGGLMLNLGRPLVFKAILGVKLSEVYMIFNFLSSVLRITEHFMPSDIDEDLFDVIPPRETRISASFIHKSMKDFLLDRERSGGFTVDVHRLSQQILTTFIGATLSCLKEGNFGPNEVYKMEVYESLERIVDEYSPNYWKLDPTPISLLSDLYLLLQRYASADVQESVILRPDIFLGSLRCIDWIATDRILHRNAGVPFLNSLCHLLRTRCYPRAVEQITDAGHLAIEESLVYFVCGNPYGAGLPPIAHFPGVHPDTLRLFLIKTQDPVIVAKFQINPPESQLDARLTEEGQQIAFQCFHLMPPIKLFFEEQIHGKYLRKYRVAFSNVCHAGLVYLATFREAPVSDKSNHETICSVMNILVNFFKNPMLSDVTANTMEEAPTFRRVIDAILGLEWTRHAADEIWPFFTRLSVALMTWRRRHIARSNVMDTLMHCDKGLGQKFQDLPTELFKAVLLPAATVPMQSTFPELFDISVGSDGDVNPIHVNNQRCAPVSFAFGLRFSAHDIFNVVENLPGDLGAQIITRAAEVYFSIWAYRLYYFVGDDYYCHAYIGLEYDSLATELLTIYYEDIYPTKLILRTLRIMRYLCKKEHNRGPFVFPRGFRDWVACILKVRSDYRGCDDDSHTEYDQKYDESEISSHEIEEFQEWMAGLKESDMLLSLHMLLGTDEDAEDINGDEIYYDVNEQ